VTDTLKISGLEVVTTIGVRDWERQLRQRLRIDLELTTDTKAAAVSDDLDDALDYGAIGRRVTAVAESSCFRLIEALAGTLAETILAEFAPRHVTVRVTKPQAIPNAGGVTVEISRSAPNPSRPAI
jgi:dihydroneopterin aldolase